ncbi:MAG: DUF4351 domain-containing protein [Bacteroidia bacterium]
MDQELQQLFPESEETTRHVDKLVKVPRHAGPDLWLLVHIEVQGYADPDFGERMFRYYYRIRDRYGLPIEALALLTDNRPGYRPAIYEATALRTRLSYTFHSCKLLDQDPQLLAEDPNPFALVLLTAHEGLRAGKLSDESLLEQKLQLFRKLLTRGYDKDTIAWLATFIQYYVKFAKPDMQQTLKTALIQLTQSQTPMGIIETVIHEEKKEAFEQGIEQEREKNIRKMIARGYPLEEAAAVFELPLARIQAVAASMQQG